MAKKKTAYVRKDQYRMWSKDEEKLKLAAMVSDVNSLTLPVGMKVQMILPFMDLTRATARVSQSRKYRVQKTVTVKANYRNHVTFTDGICDWDMTKTDIWLQRNNKVLDYGTDLEVV